ncbi:hypothetical protein GCM10023187_05580 [Nibrella viscosa]|uniref:Outer membrane protein beta-barrel domain-containing protein n=1 Tax=Nibrella viscosa TaxID=1084524 RepID=A0ABP8JW18_9BACT
MKMKVQSTFLALCLVGTGFANAQTTNSSTTTTNTTTGTYQNQSNPNTNTGTYNSGTGTYQNQSGTNMNTNSSTGTGTYSTTPSGTGTYQNQTGTYSTSPTNTNTGTYSTGTDAGSMNNSTYSTTTTTTATSADPYATRALDNPGRFGVYAGINRSNFVGSGANLTYEAKYGYQIGLYGRTGGTIFGQLGAEFRTTTSQVYRAGTVSSSEVRANLDQQFLAIPAWVGVRVGSLAGLRLQAGAELSALIGQGKGNAALGWDDVNRTQLNGLLGAGINLGPITLDAFYNHGLARIFDRGSDLKRRMFGFNVGLRF